MSFIITATDFSEVAENAVNYACRLAIEQNAQVIIIHSFIIPVMFSDIPMPGSLITDAQNDAEDQMNQLVANMKQAYPALAINGKVIYGDTVDSIEEYTGENTSPLLIVVGNIGPSETATWPDSNLMTIFKKMEYPVLAIPPHCSYKPVQKICFAFDNKHKGTDTALRQLKELATLFKSELHVLTIKTANPKDTTGSGIDEDVKKQLAELNPGFHFVSDAENTDLAIQHFNETNNIDWLVLLPRKHSFFEGLFHKSHTKAIAHHSAIPILALHEII